MISPTRYNILDPNVTKGVDDEKKASSNLLDSSKLDTELFRLGHTKVLFFSKRETIFWLFWNVYIYTRYLDEREKSARQVSEIAVT